MTDDRPQRLTVDEAAQIARESAFTIRKRCRDGVLPAAKHGRSWWILRADLDRYMRATNTPAETEEQSKFLTADQKRRQRANAS
jgi:excisionase family DNA binding protein